MNRSLLELQNIDNRITRLKRERSKLDDGTHARGERDTVQLAFDEERTRLTSLNTNRTDKELQLKTSEEKLARQQSRLMTATSAHEVTALERDIKAITAQRGDFDEAILTLMDEAETSAARLQELEAELSEKNKTLQEVEALFAAETRRLEAELEAARTERESVYAGLSDEERTKYNDFAKAHGGVAVTHSENGHCSACGMVLTAFNLREVKSQTWPTCENCGRLLFVD